MMQIVFHRKLLKIHLSAGESKRLERQWSIGSCNNVPRCEMREVPISFPLRCKRPHSKKRSFVSPLPRLATKRSVTMLMTASERGDDTFINNCWIGWRGKTLATVELPASMSYRGWLISTFQENYSWIPSRCSKHEIANNIFSWPSKVRKRGLPKISLRRSTRAKTRILSPFYLVLL